MTIETTQAQSAATILQRSVCVTLFCSYLGNNRKVALDAVKDAMHGTETLDEGAVKATKKLVDQKALRGPNGVISRAKAYLRSRAVQSHRVFGERTYLLAIGLVSEVDARLREFVTELDVEARFAAAQYAAEREKQRVKLGPLFCEGNYLNAEQVAAEWSIDWNYVSFAAPERLEAVDRALFEASKAKWDTKLGDAYHEVRLVLRQAALKIAREFSERLQPGPDGRLRTVKAGGLLEEALDFLNTLKLRDITDDSDLLDELAPLRAALAGVEASDLNEPGAVRDQVLAVATEAIEALGALVEEGGRRAVSLGGRLE